MSVRDFELQLDKEWAEKVEDVRQFVALVGLTGLRGLVLKSPVDTGRFKGNWNVGVGQMDLKTTETVDPSGGGTITRADRELTAYASAEGFPVINLTNNLPYAVRLEDGHSNQAPNGMVGLTVAELAAQFNSQSL
nr:hypothetical protein [uncultured Roseovarius sp.]